MYISFTVCDVLYQKKDDNEDGQNETEVDVEIEVENDENDDFDDTEVDVDVEIEVPDLNKDLDQIIKDIRKVVKYFRQSP